jgi:hypothetical protein
MPADFLVEGREFKLIVIVLDYFSASRDITTQIHTAPVHSCVTFRNPPATETR